MTAFKTYRGENIFKIFYIGYFFLSIFLAALSCYGFFSDAGVFATLAGIFFQIMSALLGQDRFFQRSPFAPIICFFTILSINIPISFVLFLGKKYTFGESIGGPPFPQAEYFNILPLAFIFLSVFWFTTWLAIVLVKQNNQSFNANKYRAIKPKVLILIGLLTVILTRINNLEIRNVFLSGVAKTTSILSFLFFDHAYLTLVGTILIFKLNQVKDNPLKRKGVVTIAFLIYCFFTLIFFEAGSKAALMVVFMLFFLYPLSFSNNVKEVRIMFPSPKLFLAILLLAPILFYFAFIQRVSLANGVTPSLKTLISGVSLFDSSIAIEMLERIFYRLTHGGLEQFILLFNSFIMHSFDGDTALGFFTYIVKNTINLLLPGTIFPDAYAPSSQIFPQVLLKEIVTWTGGVDVVALVKSFNTQPYTLFGIFIVIFGLLSPIVNFLFIFIFVSLYNRINVTVLKIAMLYLFSGLLSAYGFEVVIGNTFNFLISAMFITFLATNFSRAYKRTIN